MYSPFRNENGDYIDIDNLQYKHLSQLTNIDEGYKVEYKENFNDNVRNKIPAIISSFANSDGGWLFLGIADSTHDVVPIQEQRSDFSQTISQKLKEFVSPIPQFECKFLRNPECNTEGVVVIYIYPGIFPPYVSNGTIYIRNGSSKEPIKSERATIEFLFKKASSFQEKISSFCHREIYYPCTRTDSGQEIRNYVICNIYLKNLFGLEESKLRTPKDITKLWEYLINRQENLFEQMQRGQESVILWHRWLNPLNGNGVTLVLEIFFDLSIKIHIPIWTCTNDSSDNNLNKYRTTAGAYTKIFDGLTAYNCVRGSLNTVCQLLQEYKQHLEHYAFCLELENCENAVLYFSGNLYQNEVDKNGLCFACKPKIKSNFVNFIDSDLTWEQIPRWATENYFLSSFGRQVDSSTEILIEAMKTDYPDL